MVELSLPLVGVGAFMIDSRGSSPRELVMSISNPDAKADGYVLIRTYQYVYFGRHTGNRRDEPSAPVPVGRCACFSWCVPRAVGSAGIRRPHPPRSSLAIDGASSGRLLPRHVGTRGGDGELPRMGDVTSSCRGTAGFRWRKQPELPPGHGSRPEVSVSSIRTSAAGCGLTRVRTSRWSVRSARGYTRASLRMLRGLSTFLALTVPALLG